jgi:hypothetical protein
MVLEFTQAVVLTVFCVLLILLLAILLCFGRLFRRRAPTSEIVLATAAQQQRTTSEQDKKARKEWISNMLVVREWASDSATAETGPSDSNPIPEDGSTRKPPVPQDDVEAPCATEEGAGCAICLGEFQDLQLVCESNNPSCEHVFHKDCMIGWLTTKQHDDCPCCRETYLLETI